MKKVVILSLLCAFAACKQQSKPAPDAPLETPGDTIKKDTVAVLSKVPDSKLLAMNFENPSIPKVYQAGEQTGYASFGKKISPDKALSNTAMLAKYEALKQGDTVAVKFTSKVNSVCKKKGCWMRMQLPKGKESFVRFEDYGFFVPLNADNTTAIVNGKAYLEVVSIDELKHYAKDGGKSQQEIDKIKEPEVTYAFLADGVLLEK
jgi:hypothetical protein